MHSPSLKRYVLLHPIERFNACLFEVLGAVKDFVAFEELTYYSVEPAGSFR